MTLEEEIKFYAQAIGDARRTLVCEPHREGQVRDAVASQGLDAVLTVMTSPACPAGRLLVLDTPALQAAMAQDLHRAARTIRLRR
ncbi:MULTISPECIES: hypothetical protein [unclassified Streptomyces]|uniref:hypothetical protein n=1 Tax=unclassified Streptomyces TaxID=2593676 RepID=UPI000805E787|nr:MULTISPECIES: hypothetical protein [unclassified Streptomyces]MYR75150.1 hypothetical protein [Streptomyces sp. SID4925]SBU98053.1 hypothetical protein YUMDRAFT_06022 [Streptomyces sp. OspMP-M45]